MKELSKFEVASIKRTYQTVKTSYRKIEQLEAKKTKLQNEIDDLYKGIEVWETPIKMITNGMTSKEYLDSLNAEEVAQAISENDAMSDEEYEGGNLPITNDVDHGTEAPFL